MYKLFNIIAIITVACLVNVLAVANNCNEAQGIEVDATQMNGTWYETGSAPSVHFGCIKYDIDNPTNYSLSVNVTYSSLNSSLMSNKNSFNIDTNNTSFLVNAPYIINNATLKVLSVNYSSNALLCGYTDPNNANTSFVVILSRLPILPNATLIQYENDASNYLTIYNSSSFIAVNQSGCKASGAATTVPALTAILFAVYAIFKSVM